MNLTETQLAIVNSSARRIGVVACPGSGKTLVLAKRAERIFRENPSASILVFAFTKAAAAHVKARIAEEVFRESDAIGGELINCVNLRVTTFHAWAYDVVRRAHAELGYAHPPRIIDDAERSEIVKRIRPALAFGDKCPLKLIDRVIDDKSVEDSKPGQLETALTIKGLYLAELMSSCAIDFHRVIEGARTVLGMEARAALDGIDTLTGFDHVFIDEAQDVDGGLWEVMEALNPPNLLAVGDPCQAVFQWRGGDAKAFEEFTRRPSTECYHALDNFRSVASVVTGAENIHPRGMRSIAGGSEAGILHTSKFEIPGGIDVDAILARNNATLDELELRFKDQGKPFVRLRTRPEPSANVKLSRAYLRVLENPYDKPATVTCLRAMYGNDGAAYKHALENDVKGLPSSDGIVLHAEKLGEDGQAEIATYHELMRQGWTPAEYWSALAMGELEAPTPTTIPDGAVVLSTIHLAKGREWPRVALILEGLHNNEADRNVKYVGVTRAKDALYIVE